MSRKIQDRFLDCLSCPTLDGSMMAASWIFDLVVVARQSLEAADGVIS